MRHFNKTSVCKAFPVAFILLHMIFLLAGCAGAAEEQASDSAYEKDIVETADWKTSGFVLSTEISEDQTLWAEHFDEWPEEGMNSYNESLRYRGMLGAREGCFFRYFETYSDIEDGADISQSVIVLEKYDIEAKKSEFKAFTRQQMGIVEGRATELIDKMDMTADGRYVFQIVSYESNESGTYDKRVKMSYFDGVTTEVTDFTESYVKEQIMQETEEVMCINSMDCITDEQWNTYLRGNDENCLFIFAKDGSLLMKWEGEEGEQICEPMRTEAGELIFPVNSPGNESYRLIWIDTEQRNAVQLAMLEHTSMFIGYGLRGNELYYSTMDSLVKWDIATGDQQSIPLRKYGIDRGAVLNTALTVSKDGRAVMYGYGRINDEQENWLMYLTEQPIEDSEAVVISALSEQVPERVNAGVSRAMRKNKGISFSYKNPGKQADDYRNIIYAELAAGKGPDMLYVSREDMEHMQAQGMLLDLRTVLQEDLLDQVLPSVLELGTVEGTLVGIPPEITAEAMMISSDVWGEDSWTLEQIVMLMESGKLDTKLVSPYSYFSPYATAMILLRYAYADSPLIDWEKRESHFEDELFIRLLKCVGQGKEGLPLESEQDWYNGKSILTVSASSNSSYMNFSYQYYVKNGNYVGYPAEHGPGRYIDCSGVLVVNQNTENLEGVKAYFEALLSEEIQNGATRRGGLRVLKIDKSDITPPDEEGKQYWNGAEIGTDEDGATTVEWLEAFLASCVPAPRFYADVDEIVRQEIESYFAGDKTAKEVADIIDNRVQLYLNEGE